MRSAPGSLFQHPVQEGNALAAGAGLIRLESAVGKAGGNTVARGPHDRVIVGVRFGTSGKVFAPAFAAQAGRMLPKIILRLTITAVNFFISVILPDTIVKETNSDADKHSYASKLSHSNKFLPFL